MGCPTVCEVTTATVDCLTDGPETTTEAGLTAFPEMRFCRAPTLVPLGTMPPTGETLALPTPTGNVLMGPPNWLNPLTT